MRQAASPVAGRNAILRRAGRLQAAGAADADCAFLLIIQIEEVLRLQQAAGKFSRSGQAGLFVDGEDELQRTMGDVGALHHRQGSRPRQRRCQRPAWCPRPSANLHRDAAGWHRCRSCGSCPHSSRRPCRGGPAAEPWAQIRDRDGRVCESTVLPTLSCTASRPRRDATSQNIIACRSFFGRRPRYRCQRIEVLP